MSDKSIWKVVEHIDYQTGNDCVKQLLKRGYRVSEWIQDIVSRRSQNIDPIEAPIVPGAAGHGGLSQSAPCHPETQFPDHAGSRLAKTSSAARPGPG